MRRRIFVSGLFVAALVLLLTGCGKPKEYMTLVTGVVTSQDSGLPIYAAKVAFQTGSVVLSDFTKMDGSYSLSIPSGEANLIISKAGYVEYHPEAPLTLEKNGHLVHDAELVVVTPSVTIEGEVSLE